MKVQSTFDISRFDRAEFAELDSLRTEKIDGFYKGVNRCEVECIQQVIDADLNPSDYILMDKVETVDYQMVYTCLVRPRNIE